ncbi:MAG: hypothetical protein V3T23_10000 [Nitrososphaerales archaeon]
MTIPHLVLAGKHFQFGEITENVAAKLESLMPLALALEKITGANLMTVSMATPYDLTKMVSFGHLVERAAEGITPEERDWVNPYSVFMDLNKTLYRHFRNLAEQNDMGESHLTWHITHTIKHVSKLYLSLLNNPVSTDPEDLEELVRQIGWYLAFCWVAFSRAASISKFSALQTCEILAWIGLRFLHLGYKDVAKDAASDIGSILDSYCKVAKKFSPYDVADFLILIWHLHILAENKRLTELSEKLNQRMQKPSTLSEEVWPQVEEALEVRKRQLEEELTEDRSYHSALRDSPTDVLKDLLEGSGDD